MIRKRHISLTLAAIGLLGLTASAHAATGVQLPLAGAADAASLGLMGLGAFGTVATTGTDNHADKTKMFRIAKEGATTDGRTIERAWLEEMAASYDPINTYGARVNLEHIKGYTPDSPFKAYGDVLALETREEADGKLGLYAQIKPTADLVAMTKAGQKVYTSCEINPKFADTGKAYLVGLAVTDSPASLGTEMLAFSAKNPATLAKRKQAPENLFSVAEEELVLDMEAPGIGAVLLSKVKALLGKTEKESGHTDARFADVNAAVIELATHTTESIKQLTATVADQAKTIKEQADKLTALTAKLSAEPDNKTPARPLATGGANQLTTDC